MPGHKAQSKPTKLRKRQRPQRAAKTKSSPTPRDPVTVVEIGASAGGLDPCRREGANNAGWNAHLAGDHIDRLTDQSRFQFVALGIRLHKNRVRRG